MMWKLIFNSICLRIAGVFLAASVVAGCNTFGPLKKELEGYGYALMYPPRTDRGPGWTFLFAKSVDGRTVPLSICRDIWSAIEPSGGHLSLPALKTVSSVSAKLGLSVVEDLLESPVSAKAAFSDKDTITIKWGGARNLEYAFQDLFTDDGEKIGVDPSCAGAIKTAIGGDEKVEENIFIVMDVLEVQELSYTFNSVKGASLDASVDIKKLVTLKPGVEYSRTDDRTLVFKAPRYIGYNAIALRDFIDTGELGAAIMNISATPVSASKLNELAE
jgi:hypothetical protein